MKDTYCFKGLILIPPSLSVFFVLVNPVTRGVKNKIGQHGFVALMRSERRVGKEGFELDLTALGKQKIIESREQFRSIFIQDIIFYHF